MSVPEHLLDIARSGILAPSADNCLEFQLAYEPDAIEVFSQSTFDQRTPLHRRILDLMAFGAIGENMRLRATVLGYRARIQWRPPGDVRRVARIDVQRDTSVVADPLETGISSRHTNRQFYRGPALTPQEKQILQNEAETMSGVQLMWLEGKHKKSALRLVWRAESERFACKRLHEELFSAVRFDLNWHESAARGLPPATLEIEPPMRPLFKAMRNWSLLRLLNFVGTHRLLGFRAGFLPCWQAPALGLITTSLQVEDGALAAGMGLERLWLRATLLGLSMQPMAASAILPLQSDADQLTSAKTRSTLSQGWTEIAPGRTPLMVFRMGHAPAASATTSRPAPSHFDV